MKKTLISLLAAGTIATDSYGAERYALSIPSSLESSTNHLFNATGEKNDVYLRSDLGSIPLSTYTLLFEERVPAPRKLRTTEDARKLTRPYTSQLLTIILAHRHPDQGISAGQGILISHNGFLLTPAHVLDTVLEGRTKAYALMYSSKGVPRFEPLEVAALWRSCDLSLGKIPPEDLPPVSPLSLSMKIPQEGLPLIGMYLTYPSVSTSRMITPLAPHVDDRSVLLRGISLSRPSRDFVHLSIQGPPSVLTSIGAIGYPKTHAPSENHPHPALPFIPSMFGRERAPPREVRMERLLKNLVPVVLRANPGDSGTPIFDEDGALIGLISTGDRNYPYEGNITSSLMINPFLRTYQEQALRHEAEEKKVSD